VLVLESSLDFHLRPEWIPKRLVTPPYNIAVVYAGSGDKDGKFAWLYRALKQRSYYLPYLMTNARLDGLQSDPRFVELRRRIGLRE
jgi:hypothetical protein